MVHNKHNRTMKKAILYSIWLNRNCSPGYDHYLYKGKCFYLDSKPDLKDLYHIFKQSEYYLNSI